MFTSTKAVLAGLFMLLPLMPLSLSAQETAEGGTTDTSAVVFVYHRFGEDKYPSTNIRLEQLEAQIKYLKDNNFTFLSLETFTQHMMTQTEFPDKSVLFTVDDAYKSAMTEAWPRLKAAGIPMAIFVATEPVDAGNGGYLSWDDLRALKKDGVAIAHHSHSHLHMVHSGVETSAADIEKASQRFEAEMGFTPKVFAYPYGEYSTKIRAMIAPKFDLAFAQYSGAAPINSDLMSVSRFAVNERYGTMDRFKLIANSRALPVSEVIPADPYINDPSANPPLVGFTLPKNLGKASGLTCYPSHLGGESATILRPAEGRFEIRFDKALPKGRSRINCTLMGPKRRWYWFSRYFLVPGGKLD